MSYDIASAGYNLLQVIPYLVVLVGALIGINVFLVLIAGTVLSLIVGVGTGTIALSEMFTVVGDGVVSMYDITGHLHYRGMYRITCPGEWRYPFYPESDQEQDKGKERRTGRHSSSGASRGSVYSQQYGGDRNVRTGLQRRSAMNSA